MTNNADAQFARVLRSMPRMVARPGRNDTRHYLGPHLLALDPYEARITTRPVSERIVAAEFLWMLSGACSNLRYLHNNNVHIWDQWADSNGKLGPIYGVQWRDNAGAYDQIYNAIKELETNPGSSRALVTSWEPSDLDFMALPPCHFAHQVILRPVANDDGHQYAVDLHMFQRSCDVLVGLPYNMAFYGLLTQWYAQAITANTPHRCMAGTLYMHISDAHIYESHLQDPEVLEWVKVAKAHPHHQHYPQWYLPDPAPLIDLDLPSISDIPEPEALLDHCDPIVPSFPNLRIKALA